MTPLIQNIIEDNIQLLEDQNWEALFTRWYTHYASLNRSTDTKHLREFFNVCQEAGISVEEASYEARQHIISSAMHVIIENLLSHDSKLKRVGIVHVINELRSTLYLSLTELIPLYKNVVTQMGYKLAENSFTIVRS